ncbi:MAG: pilus assembly FimT family protein [Clostridium sp.]
MNLTNISNNKGITLITMMLTITVLVILLGVSTTLTITNIEKSKAQMHVASLEEKYMTLSKYISTNNVDEIIERDVEIMHPIDQEKVNVKKLDNNKIKDILNLGEFKELYLSQDNLEFFGKIDREDLTYKGVPLYVKASTNIVHNFKYDKEQSLNLPASNISDIPKNLKIGDTIIYDPTKGVTDQSKLTYTSPKDQNGYRDQTITVTSNHNEWIVISISGGQIKVISKEPIEGIEGGSEIKFTLKGGKGYLYAEEELHKMCSVFGHGKGANKITTKYTVGNPYIGEAEERKINNSGARSLTMEDIVKIMKGELYTDFTEEEKKSFYSGYKTKVSQEVYYPTKVSTKENGASDDKKSFTGDFYGITKEKYNNYAKSETKTARDALKNSIFYYKPYWYSYRCVSLLDSSRTEFSVGMEGFGFVSASTRLFYSLNADRFHHWGFFASVPKTCSILKR